MYLIKSANSYCCGYSESYAVPNWTDYKNAAKQFRTLLDAEIYRDQYLAHYKTTIVPSQI